MFCLDLIANDDYVSIKNCEITLRIWNWNYSYFKNLIARTLKSIWDKYKIKIKVKSFGRSTKHGFIDSQDKYKLNIYQ